MPRTRLNWRQNLSAPRNTALEMQNQQLRNAAILGRAAPQTDPLQEQYRQLQVLRAEGVVAKQQSDLALAIETQRQKNAYFNTIHNLDAALIKQGVKPGSFQYVEAITALREQIPYGASDKEVAEDLKKRSVVADVEAAFAERKRALSPPPAQAISKHAKLEGDIPQFEAELTGDISRQKAANIEKKLSDVPYAPNFDPAAAKIAGSLAGSKAEKAQLEKDYPQLIQPTVPTETVAAPTVAPVEPATAAVTPAPKLRRYNPETRKLEE